MGAQVELGFWRGGRWLGGKGEGISIDGWMGWVRGAEARMAWRGGAAVKVSDTVRCLMGLRCAALLLCTLCWRYGRWGQRGWVRGHPCGGNARARSWYRGARLGILLTGVRIPIGT